MSEIDSTECVQNIEKKKKTSLLWADFENNISLVACKAAHSFSTVFDCGQNNPGIGESHLTHHANMLGLCKVGLMPFEQARTIKGQRMCVLFLCMCKCVSMERLQSPFSCKRTRVDEIKFPAYNKMLHGHSVSQAHTLFRFFLVTVVGSLSKISVETNKIF